jgi:hypothetical protein
VKLRARRPRGEFLEGPHGYLKPLERDGGWHLVKWSKHEPFRLCEVARWRCGGCGVELDTSPLLLGGPAACLICWRDVGVARAIRYL